ncbi:hypothetical protein FF1_001616 [Malus domestica]
MIHLENKRLQEPEAEWGRKDEEKPPSKACAKLSYMDGTTGRPYIIDTLTRLTTFEILTSAQMVCKVWFNICKNPLMWRTIDMRGGDLYSLGKNCGNLVEVKFDDFHDAANVLEYIADR